MPGLPTRKLDASSDSGGVTKLGSVPSSILQKLDAITSRHRFSAASKHRCKWFRAHSSSSRNATYRCRGSSPVCNKWSKPEFHAPAAPLVRRLRKNATSTPADRQSLTSFWFRDAPASPESSTTINRVGVSDCCAIEGSARVFNSSVRSDVATSTATPPGKVKCIVGPLGCRLANDAKQQRRQPPGTWGAI